MRRFYLALLPWAMFDIALRSTRIDVVWASVIALVTTLLVLALCHPRKITNLDVASMVIFGGMAVGALIGHSGDSLRLYVRAVAIGGLGLVALASLIQTPCTQPYLQDIVAKRHWRDLPFRALNDRLSLGWAGAFLSIAALNLVATRFTSPLAIIGLNWILPMGLLLVVGEWSTASIARSLDMDGSTAGDLSEIVGDSCAPRGDAEGPVRRNLRLYRTSLPVEKQIRTGATRSTQR